MTRRFTVKLLISAALATLIINPAATLPQSSASTESSNRVSQQVNHDGPRLPDIDISGSANGVVQLPEDVDEVFRNVFVKYTKVVAPNGKPIHILAQDGWSDARIVKARNVLEHILTDYPGSEYGNDKSAVANSMAERRATMVLFNTEPDSREALRGPLRNADLSMQDLRANECPVEGDADYLNHETRDASYEEVLHLVHDYGIKPALPAYQRELRVANDDATSRVIWRGWPDDEVENHPNEYIGVLYDNYLDLWTVTPTKYEGRPIEPGDIPEGNSHFGRFHASSRDRLREVDPDGLEMVEKFFPPYLTYAPALPAEFSGTFSISYDPSLRYTAKSQHLRDVTLTGSNDAHLTGNAWDNRLTGNDGDNLLQGDGGNDVLDGGAGRDTAVFAGESADYEIDRGETHIRVRDKRVARDGVDLLLNVEVLRFTDRTLELE